MRHMLEKNIGLITVRQVAEGNYDHCFVSENLVESRITLSNKGIGYIFPLYLYRDHECLDLFSNYENEKRPNLSQKLLSILESSYNCEPTPEEVLSYIYSIFYCTIYREIYKEFLQVDFPRVPFTKNYSLFIEIGKLGKRLIDLHLLNSSELDQTSIKYQGHGDDHIIIKPTYVESEQRIYINKIHYFEGIEPEVWDYRIGGYQVMHKYLKDRKGRKMDDPRHYIHIATALAKTIEIQAEIDEIYPEVEKDVIEF